MIGAPELAAMKPDAVLVNFARADCVDQAALAEALRERRKLLYDRNLDEFFTGMLNKRLGQVIATGGGAILRERNRLALRQNGVVIFLERSLEKLATAGRPLSNGRAALQALYEQAINSKCGLPVIH